MYLQGYQSDSDWVWWHIYVSLDITSHEVECGLKVPVKPVQFLFRTFVGVEYPAVNNR